MTSTEYSLVEPLTMVSLIADQIYHQTKRLALLQICSTPNILLLQDARISPHYITLQLTINANVMPLGLGMKTANTGCPS